MFVFCLAWAAMTGAQTHSLSELLQLPDDEIERLIFRRSEAIGTGRASISMSPRLETKASSVTIPNLLNHPTRSALEAQAGQMAAAIGIPRHLAFALVHVESKWNVRALSPKGAMGLTQVLPSTAQGMRMTCDLYEPTCNLRAGFTYLRAMLDIFQDPRLALAAYNAGPGVFSKRYSNDTRVGIESYVLNVISTANRMQSRTCDMRTC